MSAWNVLQVSVSGETLSGPRKVTCWYAVGEECQGKREQGSSMFFNFVSKQ